MRTALGVAGLPSRVDQPWLSGSDSPHFQCPYGDKLLLTYYGKYDMLLIADQPGQLQTYRVFPIPAQAGFWFSMEDISCMILVC